MILLFTDIVVAKPIPIPLSARNANDVSFSDYNVLRLSSRHSKFLSEGSGAGRYRLITVDQSHMESQLTRESISFTSGQDSGSFRFGEHIAPYSNYSILNQIQMVAVVGPPTNKVKSTSGVEDYSEYNIPIIVQERLPNDNNPPYSQEEINYYKEQFELSIKINIGSGTGNVFNPAVTDVEETICTITKPYGYHNLFISNDSFDFPTTYVYEEAISLGSEANLIAAPTDQGSFSWIRIQEFNITLSRFPDVNPSDLDKVRINLNYKNQTVSGRSLSNQNGYHIEDIYIGRVPHIILGSPFEMSDYNVEENFRMRTQVPKALYINIRYPSLIRIGEIFQQFRGISFLGLFQRPATIEFFLYQSSSSDYRRPPSHFSMLNALGTDDITNNRDWVSSPLTSGIICSYNDNGFTNKNKLSRFEGLAKDFEHEYQFKFHDWPGIGGTGSSNDYVSERVRSPLADLTFSNTKYLFFRGFRDQYTLVE